MKLIDHSRVVHSLCQLLCAVPSQLITPNDSVGLHQVKVREVGCLGVSMPPELSRSVRLERQNPLCYHTQSLGTSSGGRLFVQIPFVLLCLMRPESIFIMSRYLQEKGTGTHGDVHPRLDLRVGYEFWRFGQRLNFYSEWLVLRIRKWLNAYGAFNSYGALLLQLTLLFGCCRTLIFIRKVLGTLSGFQFQLAAAGVHWPVVCWGLLWQVCASKMFATARWSY